MEQRILSPVSRNALMLGDKSGDSIVFAWDGSGIVEQPMPMPADKETVRRFLRGHHAGLAYPRLYTIEDVTRWWLSRNNPLTYQQALGFPDELYRYFLTHEPYSGEQALSIVQKEVVTQEEYLGIQLWYLDGHSGDAWLGPL